MAPTRSGPALDDVEHRQAGVRPGGEALAIEELALEDGEEGLAEDVVVGVAYAAHRRPGTGLAAATAEGERGKGVSCLVSGILDSFAASVSIQGL